MTAEVVVINKQAVALAADSAITIGRIGEQAKIFNTVNKLFSLSKYEPVGIMVYSSAETMGVPVETIIKAYRQKLGQSHFPTLEGYARDFYAFLTNDSDIFSEEMRFRHAESLVSTVFYRMYNKVLQELYQEHTNVWGQPTPEQARNKAYSVFVEYLEEFTSADTLDGVTDENEAHLEEFVQEAAQGAHRLFLEKFDAALPLPELAQLAVSILTKKKQSGLETGFVIAGYGTNEFFPQVRSFEFESSVVGIHKVAHGDGASVPETEAAILPFAQTEMVETFVCGRANTLDDFLQHFINRFFEEETADILKTPVFQQQPEFAKEMRQVYAAMNLRLKASFQQQLARYTEMFHIRPLMDTIAAMPKEELAVVAEALVNLTAIKRHISPDAETVGGPTDVAVISKGDGFVWIKRKHYFDATLNPQFGYNYNRKAGTNEVS